MLTSPWGAQCREQVGWVAAVLLTVHCPPRRTAAAPRAHCYHPAASSRT